MQNLKQTTLSFTPKSKKDDTLVRTRQSSVVSSAISSKSRGQYIDCVELPPPPKRGLRTKSASKPSSSKPKASPPRRRAAYTEPRKPSLKRRLSSNLESDVEQLKEIAHIPRITVDAASSPAQPKNASTAESTGERPSPPKKRRFTSSPLSDLTPLASSLPGSSVHEKEIDDEAEFVPTSQSDEQELELPRIVEKDPTEILESVDKWRKKTLPGNPPPSRPASALDFHRSSSVLSDISMDIDYDPFTTENVPGTPISQERSSLELPYPQTPCSTVNNVLGQIASSSTLATPAAHPEAQRIVLFSDASPSDAFTSLTPPPSSDIDAGQTQEEAPAIEVLDVKSKTEKLIADIKARAVAAAHSSPEPSLDFDALSDWSSDSSSDDETPGAFVAALVREAQSRKARATPSDAGRSKAAFESTSRYNLRRASPSTSTSKPKEKLAPPATQARKPRKTDPLGKLLREKEREERTGTGMAAVRLAEQTVARARHGLCDEMEDEEDGSGSDSDGEPSLHFIAEGKGKSKSPMAGLSRTQKAKLGQEDAEYDYGSLLGDDENSKAVKQILANDVQEEMAQALAKENERLLGEAFWSQTTGESDEMDAEIPLPPFTAEVGGSTLRQLLKDVSTRNDVARISALLASGFVAHLGAEHYSVVVPWLFDLAFSGINLSITTLAYTQLKRLSRLVDSRPSGLRLSTVLAALMRMGASPEVLAKHGWAQTAPLVPPSTKASALHRRGEMTYRLVSLLNAYAQSFVRDELSDLTLALILIGMDPSTSEELQTDIRQACDSLALAMTLSHEFAACTRIVAIAKSLTPPNQALLISFVPCISPATVRMSRCVARALLLDATPSAVEYQEELPALRPLIELLSPSHGSGRYFDILANAEKEGYFDDLVSRVTLVSKALTDIDEYTIVEKRSMQDSKKTDDEWKGEEDDEPDNEKDAPKMTALEQIKRALEVLHGRIVDTRAAHLDRSRAKAALQRLALRIHYQRIATLKSAVSVARPRNLLAYFHGGPSSHSS